MKKSVAILAFMGYLAFCGLSAYTDYARTVVLKNNFKSTNAKGGL